ncbi:Norsolorinic acid reductase A [Hyphodiscus hymeniophilus]|uniref:Norsolorinic acid reductase A n=1 Tax=Hyphodiscus hymeniophilus TaxID=353542 RepID=A0A9P6VN43_9HELO|nr:Norsolorinic acid reductase A [Hyphodiscus hymeniophilus]
MSFTLPPKPKNGLGYHRMLSPTAAVRVSPLCLGAMNFGESWKDFMGECTKETAEEMLDLFYENGGNFIDTANNYQKGESEKWIGDWMKKRGVRDQMVVATKFTTPYRTSFGDTENIANTGGNGTKSLHTSLQWSLNNLQTSYVDLLYVHWYDHVTSIPELMQSLNVVVNAGKVLYLGASDTPAWYVAKANQYARDHGLRQFSVYQGKWSAAARDFERDIIPMAISEGRGLAPWGALGAGDFKSPSQRALGEGRVPRIAPSEAAAKVTVVLEKIAKDKDSLITSVALAYVMQKTPYVFPVVGGRKVEHLKGNIEALSLVLSDDDVKAIEDAIPFDIGFPGNFLGKDASSSWMNAVGGHFQYVEGPKPIAPHGT